MADAADSKSAAREGVRVRVPLSAVYGSFARFLSILKISNTRKIIRNFQPSLTSIFYVQKEDKMGKKITMLMQNETPTVSECFQLYIRKCEVRNMSDKTLKVYKAHHKDLLLYNGQKLDFITDITSETIDNYILNKRAMQSCNQITINSYLRSTRAFLYWCMEQRYLPPFSIPIPKTDKKIKATYTDTELKVLLKKPNIKKVSFTQYKIWVLSNYLLATGNRISSALNLKICNFDFDDETILIEKTKNRRQQIIPMSRVLKDIIGEYLTYRNGNPDEYVFCNNYGGVADQRTIQQEIADYNKVLGIYKTSAHLYRHTFAKKWILNGGDIFRLQKILGHSDLTVVKEYVNMFSNDIAIDFDKFNPLDNMKFKIRQNKIHMK